MGAVRFPIVFRCFASHRGAAADLLTTIGAAFGWDTCCVFKAAVLVVCLLQKTNPPALAQAHFSHIYTSHFSCKFDLGGNNSQGVCGFGHTINLRAIVNFETNFLRENLLQTPKTVQLQAHCSRPYTNNSPMKHV